jgi:hypothetical protein
VRYGTFRYHTTQTCSQKPPWQLADHDGLVIEVLPTGRKIWRFRYRFDNKSQKITLGEYPAFSLAEARLWREKCRSMVAYGINPAQKKQEEKLKQKDPTTVKTFAKRWLTDIVEKSNRDPRNITRVIEKVIIPIIGKLELEELTTAHIQIVLDRIKQRGSDHVAPLTRNVLKRMLAYAISRGNHLQQPGSRYQRPLYRTSNKPRRGANGRRDRHPATGDLHL